MNEQSQGTNAIDLNIKSFRKMSSSTSRIENNTIKTPEASKSPQQISNRIANLQNRILNSAKKSLQNQNSVPSVSVSSEEVITDGNIDNTLSINPAEADSEKEVNGDNEVDDSAPQDGVSKDNREWLPSHAWSRRNRRNANFKQKLFVTGVRKDASGTFKSVEKVVDVFIGRVHTSVDSDSISSYITENFDVNCSQIEKLNTRADDYNCFKVSVNINDRDKLFKPDLWPEGIVINKFFTRSFSKKH